MRRPPARSLWCAALAVVLIAGGTAACGKRGGLKAPEGEEGRYTYPSNYPDPASVLPQAAPAAVPPAPAAPSPAGDITTFPEDRRRTKTYGPVIVQ